MVDSSLLPFVLQRDRVLFVISIDLRILMSFTLFM